MNSIPELIEDIRQGKMVILLDDEDRENEGDLIMAAEKAQAADINFMARFGRGLICLTITKSRSEQLHLSPMVSNNRTQHGTNFTASIEAASGVSTGISAADRAHTIKTAVAKAAKPEDLVQPGHVFPLVAKPGGVLYRAGHTEAGCDLAKLAGCEPAAVIVEILNEDGTMARRPELEDFAKAHQLKMGTIADLIQYRLVHEKSIERVSERDIHTEFGSFRLVSYLDNIAETMHYAFVCGEIDKTSPTLTRVHVEDKLYDLLHVKGPKGRWPLNESLAYIASQGCGVVVLLSHHDTTSELITRLTSTKRKGYDEKAANDFRVVGTGSQILSDLGVHKLKVMGSPKKYHALSGFELEIVDYVPYDK